MNLIHQNNLDIQKPDFKSLLQLSRHRYEATYISEDSQRKCVWDCTGFLCSQYTLAEFWEITQEKKGSFLTNSIREDSNAPDWVRTEEVDGEENEVGFVTVRPKDNSEN